MTTAPTLEKQPAIALRLGAVTLRWIDLATLAAMDARARDDAQLIRPIKRRLLVWRPLDEFTRRYAFTLGQVGRLYQWQVIPRLHGQGLLTAATHYAPLTDTGHHVAQLAVACLPAPLPADAYARVLDMLYTAKRHSADFPLALRLSREIIHAHKSGLADAPTTHPTT